MSGVNTQPTPEEQAAEIKVLDQVTAPDAARPSGEGSVGLVKGEDGKTAEERAVDTNNDPHEVDAVDQDDVDDVSEEDDTPPADEASDDFDDVEDDTDEDDIADEGDDEGLGLEELLAEDEEEKPRKRNKMPARKRIAELTAHRRAAEERADKAERELAELKNQRQLTDDQGGDKTETNDNSGAKGDTDENAPKPEDYTYGELDSEYIKDTAKYEVRKEIAAERAEQDKERQAEAAQKQAVEVQQKYDEKLEAGKAAYDDFEEVLTRADEGKVPITPETALMALNSPVGEHVVYALATNPKMAKEVAGMDAMGQARAFGRLEARYTAGAESKPKKRQATKAPPPPSKRSRGVSSRNSMDPKTASVLDLEKKWNSDGRV